MSYNYVIVWCDLMTILFVFGCFHIPILLCCISNTFESFIYSCNPYVVEDSGQMGF